MQDQLELNVIAALVLKEGDKHNAPQPVTVATRGYPFAGEIHLQLPQFENLRELVRGMALWAQALGGSVTITARPDFVNLAVTTRVEGFEVEVWDHVPYLLAGELTEILGGADFKRGAVTVNPEVLFAALDAQMAAA